MKEKINYCFNSQIVASFYCDIDNSEAHYTGYVYAYNDSEIIIAHISPYGFYDGYVIRQIDDIYKIEFNGAYEHKIEKLYKLRGQSHKNICDSDTLFFGAIEYARENKLIVSLYFDTTCVTGTVNNIDAESISISCLNDNGTFEGMATVKIDDVFVAEIDTEYEQSLALLVNNQ